MLLACFRVVQCPCHALFSFQQYTDLAYLRGSSSSLNLAMFISTGQ